MENNQSINDPAMTGVLQILGLKPYVSVPLDPVCEHVDDGHEYGETSRFIICKCAICGVFYEQKK